MSEHDADKDHRESASNLVVGRGLKILGETVAPGASLVLDGKILPGAAHLVGGFVARWAFGPVGWLLVAANSYSKSVTGRNLPEHLIPRSESAVDSSPSRDLKPVVKGPEAEG